MIKTWKDYPYAKMTVDREKLKTFQMNLLGRGVNIRDQKKYVDKLIDTCDYDKLVVLVREGGEI